MDDLINVNEDVMTTHDESAGLQNAAAGAADPNYPATDADDNDIVTTELPDEFAARLTALGASPDTALGAALSGYDGANNGEDVITVTSGSNIVNLALTDADGNALDGASTGVTTTDGGNEIFLYTDTENDNIVLGREGTGSTPNPDGDIVIAIYLDESVDLSTDAITGARIWTVQYEALAHSDPNSYDESEPVDLSGTIYATASQDVNFDVSNAPSGQNKFIMFGDGEITEGNDEVGIVVTGISAVHNVNTSQGGGPTTFGVDNQKIDADEALYFTFVTGPVANYTVPNLSSTAASNPDNIQFNEFLDAKGAEFEVTQLQPASGTSVVKITAYDETQDAAAVQGANFFGGLNNDDQVAIDRVVVLDASGTVLADSEDPSIVSDVEITFDASGSATISGVEAHDTIQYTTTDDHNRVLIENAGGDVGGASFDVGGFKLTEVQSAIDDVGFAVRFEDDGPSASAGPLTDDDMAVVDESPVAEDGILSASFNVADNFATGFDYGTDGEGSEGYTLELSGTDVGSGLYALDPAGGPDQGEEIVLNLVDGAIVGTSSQGTHFTISLVGDEVTLTLGDANIWHGDTGDPDDTETLTAAAGTLVVRQTVTDADGDTASDTLDLSAGVFKFEDDGPSASAVALTEDDMAVVDESPVAEDGILSASFNVADNFATGVDYGTDGPGSEALTLELAVEGAGSGLFALDPAGGPAQGEEIVLTQDPVTGTITGSSSQGTHFTISLVGDEVTLTLGDANIWHGDTGDPDDTETLTAAAGTLVVRQTVTDADGDTASDTLDLSAGVFKFEDDGPAVDSVSDPEGEPLEVDETNLGTPDTADFSDNFTPLFDGGTDGEAGTVTTAYTLGIGEAGPTTNLVDLATDEAVVLSVNDDRTVVSGTVIDGDGIEQTVFTVSVDSSGTVTLDQQRALKHPIAGATPEDHDDTVTLGADLITLTRTDKITDVDGDKAEDSADLDIGKAMSFDDDGPALTDAEDLTITNIDGSTGEEASGSLTYNAGADGVGGFTISDAPGDEGTDWSYDDSTQSSITGSYDGVDYSLMVNDNGEYVFTLLNELEGPEIHLDTNDIKAGGPDTTHIEIGALGSDMFAQIIGFDADGNLAAVNESHANVGVVNGNLDEGEAIKFRLVSEDTDPWDETGANLGGETLVDVTSLSIGTKSAGEATYNYVAYNDGEEVFTGQITVPKNGTIQVSNDGEVFDEVEVTLVDGQALKLNMRDVSIELAPDDRQLSFEMSMTDGDGDAAGPVGFDVGIDANGDGAVVIPEAALLADEQEMMAGIA